jgi:hypothetical protein
MTMTRKMQRRPPLDVEPIAQNLVDLVQAGYRAKREARPGGPMVPTPTGGGRLDWEADGRVHVVVARSLPQDPHVSQQTRLGWTRRLRDAVRVRLLEAGWRDLGENHYAPPAVTTK